MQSLTVETPDLEKFPGLGLAYDALRVGGTMGAILNGATEVAVDAFLNDRIRFGQIAQLVEETMQAVPVCQHPTLDMVLEADLAARAKAQALLKTSRFAV